MKKKKQSLNHEYLSDFTLQEQADCFEAALDQLDDHDYDVISSSSSRITRRLQYGNHRARIDHGDGLEVLAKLGIFLASNGESHG